VIGWLYFDRLLVVTGTDYAKEEFGKAAADLNDDDYLWQREKGTGGSQFAKREEDKGVFGYRKNRMQTPAHRGQFKDLIAKEKKEREIAAMMGQWGGAQKARESAVLHHEWVPDATYHNRTLGAVTAAQQQVTIYPATGLLPKRLLCQSARVSPPRSA
jgi:hypothetical protein